MLRLDGIWQLVRPIFSILIEVLFFWQLRLYAWWTRKRPISLLADTLADSQLYEEWEGAAFQLDELHGNDLWRQNATSKYYDYRLIFERLQAIIETREDEDILGLVNLLRSGLVRNLGNITAPRLFNRAYAGTKLLIEDYITHVALAIEHVAAYPTSSQPHGLTSQAKLDLLHDTRQAFGRTALVLQGGAIFGLCHIGVVKALHLRGILPRIICGTATGALIAALVGVHDEDELLDFLTPEGIDLSAFAIKAKRNKSRTSLDHDSASGMFATALRRIKRFVRDGYFLDVKVLEECVHANVGDSTFEEAYARTKRVLNITVPSPEGSGVPSLLNYLTAPNVLIWSAAIASNSASGPLFHPSTLLCKDSNGQIVPWSTLTSTMSSQSRVSLKHPTDIRDSPLSRIAELFNVNHFIISQARPYIAPFLQTSDVLSHAIARHANNRRRGLILHPLLRIVGLEMEHRLRQLDALGLLPSTVRRFLVDEMTPAASTTLVPELHASDFFGLLERPTRRSVAKWILRGERSVWPAVSALKVRCAVEVELDRAYQIVRRRKPMDAIGAIESEQLKSQDDKRKKTRSSSFQQGE